MCLSSNSGQYSAFIGFTHTPALLKNKNASQTGGRTYSRHTRNTGPSAVTNGRNRPSPIPISGAKCEFAVCICHYSTVVKIHWQSTPPPDAVVKLTNGEFLREWRGWCRLVGTGNCVARARQMEESRRSLSKAQFGPKGKVHASMNSAKLRDGFGARKGLAEGRKTSPPRRKDVTMAVCVTGQRYVVVPAWNLGFHAQVVDFPHIASWKIFFGGRKMEVRED